MKFNFDNGENAKKDSDVPQFRQIDTTTYPFAGQPQPSAYAQQQE